MKRRAPSFKELSASNGAYTGQDIVWLGPETTRPSGCPQPKPADKIIDSTGITWTVLEASLNTLKSTWRMMTRNIVLAHQLYDLIDIQRSAVTYDAAGSAVRAWSVFAYRGLAAKVQLLTEESAVVLGVSGLKGTYAVFVERDVTIKKQDRVAWYTPSGTVYLDILGQHNPQRIDELPVLDTILQP